MALAALAAAGILVLAGCTDAAPTPSPTATSAAPSVAATPTPTPTDTAPVLVPTGSAEDNLPLFASVVDDVAASDQSVEGRAYIDALVAAGFAKDDMEVTRDRTSVGLPADAIQFSVRWGDECLVGQVGPSTPAPTAVVVPLLPGGTCLIGQTRPIDW